MTPELYTPGMAAGMMDVLGHEFRCPVPGYMKGRAMPSWPARRPLVSAIPSAVMHVQLEHGAQQEWLRLSAQAFCGGLTIGEVMEK